MTSVARKGWGKTEGGEDAMTTRKRGLIWLELIVVVALMVLAWYFGLAQEAGGYTLG